MEDPFWLTRRLVARTQCMRDDILAVEFFRPSYAALDDAVEPSLNEQELFWAVFSPQSAAVDPSSNEIGGWGHVGSSRLPADIEDVFLDRLAALEREHRVPYQPDETPSDDPSAGWWWPPTWPPRGRSRSAEGTDTRKTSGIV